MNWTGGQLRRHSGRHNILSKSQRQNSAKSGQLASNRVFRQPSPVRGVPDRASWDDDAICRAGQGTVREEAQDHLKTMRPSLPLLAGIASADGTNGLDTLKRRLLQDPDWAAVSAARPLQVALTPADEIERFGKRRKLNQADRKRLSAAHGSRTTNAFSRTHWRDKHASSERDTPAQIKIWITGQAVGQRLGTSPEVASNRLSSQSMLLDHEETMSLRSPLGRQVDHDFTQS
ncbi:uncharacterized protein N7482_009967 [Penicillium canariense]|uniref:Uncharacterized protein n=1 Tax=Penicillium canariense TaxID=189055 RepID=A0A9W9LG72_9EURO|nr:uncharacterized protein N7482_009967 [Penicillium canariense]KAJ5153489.1 hypothetical protein N7482_009967 [Penicillium canariense]